MNIERTTNLKLLLKMKEAIFIQKRDIRNNVSTVDDVLFDKIADIDLELMKVTLRIAELKELQYET